RRLWQLEQSRIPGGCCAFWRCKGLDSRSVLLAAATSWAFLASLGEDVVVLNGPLGESRGVANGRLAQRCVAHAKHLEFRRHAVQIRADAVKVRVRGAMGQG